MTRRLPPSELQAALKEMELREAAAARIFQGTPKWQAVCALSALYRLRPELGEVNDEAHQLHMLMWPRDPLYFARVCQFLKMYGVGSEWGPG